MTSEQREPDSADQSPAPEGEASSGPTAATRMMTHERNVNNKKLIHRVLIGYAALVCADG
jgi:hypothetical protein